MKRMIKNTMQRGRHAFTLIEVMVALAVVTLGLVAVLGLIPIGLKCARDTADNTLAATTVQDIFTNVRSTFKTCGEATPQPLSGLVTYHQSPPLWFGSDGNGPVAVGAGSYFQVDLTYERVIPGLTTLYRVTAVVTWPAHIQVTPSSLPGNTFVTEIAKLGP